MDIPKFRKVYALIPESIWLELVQKNIFNSNFDQFIADAITEKLQKEGRI